MRREMVLNGVTVLTALVLMGAGCSGSGSVQEKRQAAPVDGGANIYINDTPGSDLPGGAPVKGYESDLSDPSQK